METVLRRHRGRFTDANGDEYLGLLITLVTMVKSLPLADTPLQDSNNDGNLDFLEHNMSAGISDPVSVFR